MGANIVMKWYLYDWGGLNVWLFHFINNIRSEILDQTMLALTALGAHQLFNVYITLLILTAFTAILKTPVANHHAYQEQSVRWMSVIAVFGVAYLLDGLFLGIIKPLLDFPRPPLALPIETIYIIGQAQYHHSFPSGHSSFAMLIVASIWPILHSWQKGVGIAFVLLVGLSRISLGAHFPADVMAGWISSLIIVLAMRLIISKWTLYSLKSI